MLTQRKIKYEKHKHKITQTSSYGNEDEEEGNQTNQE